MPVVFQIDNNDTVRVADPNAEPAELEQVFASFEQFEHLSADWPLRRLVGVWNQLPGVQPVSRFENRTVGLNRIWRALNASAGEGEPGRRPRRGRGRQNKSELVLDMVRGPNGATLKALMKATRWQAHTVRGFLSRKVSKSLGLPIDSFRRDGERVYAVRQPQHLAAE
jgi:Protein of unknown function (DUF3489)